MVLEDGETILDKYFILEQLGDGCYGEVYLVQDVNTNDLYAIKAINKKHFKKNKELERNLFREVRIHSKLKHQNIVLFYKELKDQNYVYFLLEFITPGELFDQLYKHDTSSDSEDDSDSFEIKEKDEQRSRSLSRLNDKMKNKKFDEKRVRHYIKQLIDGLVYLRNNNIIHRDIKPENILITEEDVLKIADFGWACEKKSRSCVGTCHYNAPEMINNQVYDYKSDIWSMGIVFFELLYKKRPFKGEGKNRKEKEKKTERLICHSPLKFPSDPEISDQCKHLLEKILTKDPRRRPNYEWIKDHEWFKMDL